MGAAAITVMRLTTARPDHESLETNEAIELSRVASPGTFSLNVQDVCQDSLYQHPFHLKQKLI